MNHRICIILILLAVLRAPAFSLEPAEVVVVANSDVPVSVALGRWYCSRRGLDERQLIALPLGASETISLKDYQSKVAEPLRGELYRRGLRDRAKCLLTMYGVPYRIEASELSEDTLRLLEMNEQAREGAHKEMAKLVAWLETIGETFPATARPSTNIDELNMLFDPDVELPDPLPDFETLADEFKSLAETKARGIVTVDDPQLRAIQCKQFMALHFRFAGVPGLPKAVELLNPVAPPISQRVGRAVTAAKARAEKMGQLPPTPLSFGTMIDDVRMLAGVAGLYATCDPMAKMFRSSRFSGTSALDSELALVLWRGYSYDGWRSNVLHLRLAALRDKTEYARGKMFMVSRLDGPDPEAVMRMVINGMRAETEGLDGVVYIDGGPGPVPGLEAGLKALAELLGKQCGFKVALDERPEMFAPGSCPDAAIYVGWYSPEEYIPAFQWKPGAIAFHIGKAEASGLRDPESQTWVPRMIADGVSVTLGGVDDPMFHAYPLPTAMLGMLVSGECTVSEAYWKSLPHSSWRMMLLADPLYNPFKNNPRLELPEGFLDGIMPSQGGNPLGGQASPATQAGPRQPGAGAPRRAGHGGG